MMRKKDILTVLVLIPYIFSSVSYAQQSGKILEYRTDIKFDNRNLTEQRSLVFQIDNKQSDWLSDISISYNAGTKLELLDCYVTNSKGIIIRKLQKKEITTSSDISNISFYEDNLVKKFSLRNNEYPYFVSVSYRKTYDKFRNIAFWSPLDQYNIPVANASLRVELGADFKTRIFVRGDFTFKRDSSEGKIIYSWEDNNIKAIKRELYTPPVLELIPLVIVVPQNFSYGIPGSLESWRTFGEWLSETNKGLDSLPLSEQIKVTSLLKGTTDRYEKMKKLYHYMQDNTHYINVSIDIGGFKPYPASYVCNNKYGDCKALSIYMKALLKFAGIESYYTIINAGSNPVKTDTSLPYFQFNHVILCVPEGKDTTWLENTSQEIPFGYTGTFTQGRYALVANGPASRLVKKRAMTPEELRNDSKYFITPLILGNSPVSVFKKFRGYDFTNWLSLSAESDSEEIRDAVRDELPVKNEIVRYQFVHPDREQDYFVLKADYKADNIVRELGATIAISSLPIEIISFEKPEARQYPVRIFYPLWQVDTIEYDLQYFKGYELSVPANISITTRFGNLNVTFTKEKEKAIIVRSLFIRTGDYQISEYGEFYAFIESIRKTIKTSQIILNRKQ